MQGFVDELCRLDGRGDFKFQKQCGSCEEQDPRFRCRDGCFSDQLYCQSCMVAGHRDLPFHSIEVSTVHLYQRSSHFSYEIISSVGRMNLSSFP